MISSKAFITCLDYKFLLSDVRWGNFFYVLSGNRYKIMPAFIILMS